MKSRTRKTTNKSDATAECRTITVAELVDGYGNIVDQLEGPQHYWPEWVQSCREGYEATNNALFAVMALREVVRCNEVLPPWIGEWLLSSIGKWQASGGDKDAGKLLGFTKGELRRFAKLIKHRHMQLNIERLRKRTGRSVEDIASELADEYHLSADSVIDYHRRRAK